MRDVAAPGDLMLSWVEVIDERGRSRMEARWRATSETGARVNAVGVEAA